MHEELLRLACARVAQEHYFPRLRRGTVERQFFPQLESFFAPQSAPFDYTVMHTVCNTSTIASGVRAELATAHSCSISSGSKP